MKYDIFVRAEDGRHKLNKRAVSLEKAKELANDWLGTIATWTSETRAVSKYGGVLTIEEREER